MYCVAHFSIVEWVDFKQCNFCVFNFYYESSIPRFKFFKKGFGFSSNSTHKWNLESNSRFGF
jgi:hypothetical protein